MPASSTSSHSGSTSDLAKGTSSAHVSSSSEQTNGCSSSTTANTSSQPSVTSSPNSSTRCPDLSVLTTSRERLGLPVEHTYRLQPLAVPASDAATDLESVPSVALFVVLAQRTRPEFSPDPTQLVTIAGIVRRLDGLPLAIELAAGRLSTLDIDDLGARLDRALDLLHGGRTTADARHQTLRSTVEWSYRLLHPDEQRLFRHLAVYPDGFDLVTAEQVATDLGGTLEPVGALAHLVDASMITASLGGRVRYRMLDTLRSFGLDQLVDRARARRRHRAAAEVGGGHRPLDRGHHRRNRTKRSPTPGSGQRPATYGPRGAGRAPPATSTSASTSSATSAPPPRSAT